MKRKDLEKDKCVICGVITTRYFEVKRNKKAFACRKCVPYGRSR